MYTRVCPSLCSRNLKVSTNPVQPTKTHTSSPACPEDGWLTTPLVPSAPQLWPSVGFSGDSASKIRLCGATDSSAASSLPGVPATQVAPDPERWLAFVQDSSLLHSQLGAGCSGTESISSVTGLPFLYHLSPSCLPVLAAQPYASRST